MPDSGTSRTIVRTKLLQKAGFVIEESGKIPIQCAAEESFNVLKLSGSATMRLIFDGGAITVHALACDNLAQDALISFTDLVSLGVIPEDFPTRNFASTCALTFEKKEVQTTTPQEVDEGDDELDLDMDLDGLVEEYDDVFDEETVSPVKGPPMKVALNRSSKDYHALHVSKARKVPQHFQGEADKVLQAFLDSGVIERVPEDHVTEWCSPGFFVPKPNGKVRLVVDYRGINKFITRPVHPFPSPRDIIKDIKPDSKWFLKLDATWGYYQIPLHEDSKDFTTFLLPSGRYRFARAPMGLCPSSDAFCVRTDNFLKPVPDMLKIVDDGLLQARTKQELLKKFQITLQCCRQHNLTLARKKISYGQEIQFAGYLIGKDGVKPDPARVEAISKFKRPADVQQIRSFLGLVNQLGFFIPDLAQVTTPLRELLRKDVAFQWLPIQEEAFKRAKDILTSDLVVKPFDAKLKTELLTDAARLGGLGYALIQRHEDGTLRLIQCGSRSLSGPESRYATNELEALAIVYAVKDCHFYLYGGKFTVITDHKPLLGTFRKDLFDIENPRLQRLCEKLIAYNFDMEYTPGKYHYIADALSRAPHFGPKHQETVVCNHVLVQAVAEDPALQEVYEAAAEDEDYRAIVGALLSGKSPSSLPPSHPARVLKAQWDDISIMDEKLIVFQSERLFIPAKLRRAILDKLHTSHSGISKTKSLARRLYFWPGISKEIENLISNCEVCHLHRPSLNETTQSYAEATAPFQAISLDLFELGGAEYLVMVDRYSYYIWVKRLFRTTTDRITACLDSWFREFGYPATVVTDNGPQFRGDFKAYCTEHNVVHITSSPYNSRSNGLAESAVKQAKLLLKKSDNFEDFARRLQAWRNVPSTNETLSPAEKFYGRRQRYGLPTLGLPPLPTTPGEGEPPKLTPFNIGDLVSIQDVFTKEWSDSGEIISVRPSGGSYEVKRNSDGKVISRNRRFLLPLNAQSVEEANSDPGPKTDSETFTVRRSERQSKPPARFTPQ